MSYDSVSRKRPDPVNPSREEAVGAAAGCREEGRDPRVGARVSTGAMDVRVLDRAGGCRTRTNVCTSFAAGRSRAVWVPAKRTAPGFAGRGRGG